MREAYLIAVSGMGILWLMLFVFRKDLRKKMFWCSGYLTVILSFGFLLMRILFANAPAEQQIVPGYWNPDTLFNLGRITAGWSIEDALYMFFTGGIVSVIYDVLSGREIPTVKTSSWRRRRAATLIPALVVCGMAFFLRINFIWELIAFCASGALIIWFARPDLVVRSLVGGSLYAGLYYAAFSFLFLNFFPTYLTTHYNLANLSGLMIGRIPLEEMAFALFFGLMWSPIYEYAKDIPSRQPTG